MKWFIYSFISLWLVGCGSVPTQSKQCLRLNFHTDPPTLDPRKGGDMTSVMMHYLLFEGLTRLTPDGPTQPGTAERIEISEDKLTYTFHLRKAMWSDNSPITAYDFVYSWKKMLDPTFACFNAHLLYPIENAREAKQGQLPLDTVGLTAVNEDTLIVKLKDPTPYFLELTAFPALYPVNRLVADTNKEWSEGPPHPFVCNGPFRVVKWKHCNMIKLERNPHYWDRDKIHLDNIQVTMIENEHTALQLFEKGNLDIMGAAYTGIPTDAIAKFKQLGLLQDYPVAATSACTFNLSKPPFNNVHIRKALSSAIDREAIVKNITALSEDPAFSLLHPTLVNWEQSIPQKEMSPLEHFKKGLEELGLSLKDLPSLHFVYANNDLNHQIAQAIQHQWKNTFGLNIQLESAESKVYFSKLIHHDYDIGLFVMRAQYPDPMNILERFKYPENQKNYPGWSNAAFVKLLDTQMYAPTPEKRGEMLEAAQQILLSEMPIAPIFHWRYAFMHNPNVKNIFISPGGQIVLHWAKIVDEKNKAA